LLRQNPWSTRHRGLLIRRASRIDVNGVVREPNQRLRVRAATGWNDTFAEVQQCSHAFSRNGFAAQTEVVPGK